LYPSIPLRVVALLQRADAPLPPRRLGAHRCDHAPLARWYATAATAAASLLLLLRRLPPSRRPSHAPCHHGCEQRRNLASEAAVVRQSGGRRVVEVWAYASADGGVGFARGAEELVEDGEGVARGVATVVGGH